MLTLDAPGSIQRQTWVMYFRGNPHSPRCPIEWMNIWALQLIWEAGGNKNVYPFLVTMLTELISRLVSTNLCGNKQVL